MTPLYYGDGHEYGSLAGRAGVGVGAPAIVGLRPRNRWRCRPAGPAPAATLGPCGAGASAPAPSRTSARSTTSRWPSAAVVRAASCPCKHALALLLLWARGQVAEGSPPPFAAIVDRQAAGDCGGGRAPGTAEPATPPVDATVDTTGRTSRSHHVRRCCHPPARAQQDPRRSHRPHGGRARRARPLARRPVAHRPRRSVAGQLQDVGRAGRAADRCPGRRVGQSCASTRRAGRCASRLALAGAWPSWACCTCWRRRAGISARCRRTSGRLGRRDHRLAGPPGRRAGRRAADRPLGGDGPQRHRAKTASRCAASGCAAPRRGEWAMVLSFAAFQQSLDTSFDRRHAGARRPVPLSRRGRAARAGGPAARRRRSLPGRSSARRSPRRARRSVGRSPPSRGSSDIRCASLAAPTRAGGRWLLTDSTGSLPLVDGAIVGTLLACSAGRPTPITAEWTPAGLVPLTVHLADRAVDIGPVADSSFVKAAS